MSDEDSHRNEISILELGELKTSAPREALAFWQTAAVDDQMPVLSAIDPLKLRSFLPDVVLIDVIWPDAGSSGPEAEAPADYRLRLVGQHSVDAHGVSATGRKISTLSEFGPGYVRQSNSFYAYVCEKKRPVAVRGPLKMIGKNYRRFEAVYLPFSSDGTRVDRIMVAVEYS